MLKYNLAFQNNNKELFLKLSLDIMLEKKVTSFPWFYARRLINNLQYESFGSH